MKPNNIILECIVGSHMYNLQTESSDIDIKGIYIEPTESFLGLHSPPEVKDHTDPDWAYYELTKFVKLALKGNPTILELLWAGSYNHIDTIGLELVKYREKFLSKKCKNSYLGYAMQQVSRKYRNASSISEYQAGKHVRHTWRLVKQYEEMALTGKLRVRLTEEERKECFSFMEKSYDECLNWFLEKDKELKNINSILPDNPDYDFWDTWLKKIRRQML